MKLEHIITDPTALVEGKIYLKLLNGRKDPDTDMRDFGPDGPWYDTSDAQGITQTPTVTGWNWVVQPDSPFAEWDAIVSESCFSGVLFHFVDEFERVVVGRYLS